MAKAPALMRSPEVRDIIKESTVDDEIGGVLKDIAGFLKGISEGVANAVSFIASNWQLLAIGVVGMVILSKRR